MDWFTVSRVTRVSPASFAFLAFGTIVTVHDAHAQDALFSDGFENFSTPTPTFVAPLGQPTSPAGSTLAYRAHLDLVDVYFGIDDTGSMAAELAALRNNWPAVHANLRCTSSGASCQVDDDCTNGEVCTTLGTCAADPAQPPGCVADIFSGAATWSELDTFRNRVAIQADPVVTASLIPSSTTAGAAEAPFQPPSCVANAANCPNAAQANCAAGGVGCAGFRDAVVRLYVQITDADQQCSGAACASYTAARAGADLAAANIRFLGIVGTDDGGGTGTPLSVAQEIAVASGSVDRMDAALVESAADAAVPSAVASLVTRALFDTRTRATLQLEDLDGDDGDALAFIQRVATFQPGTPQCPLVGTTTDEQPPGGDGVADTYIDLMLGTRLCWTLVPIAMNTTVSAPGRTLYFRGRATLLVDGHVTEKREFSIAVPPP